MGLRPLAARWFELLTPRDQLAATLRCLANTGAVELEAHSEGRAPLVLPALREPLDEYADLARRYGAYWPSPRALPTSDVPGDPGAMLERAGAGLRRWAAEAAPVIERLQALETRRRELELLGTLIDRAERALPDLGLFPGAGPLLAGRVFSLPGGSWPEELPPSVIARRVPAGERVFMIAAGLGEQVDRLEQQLAGLKARELQVPQDMPSDPEAARTLIADRLDATDGEIRAARSELGSLERQHRLTRVLSDFALVRWFADNIPQLPATEQFAWITGWTSDPNGNALRSMLRRAGVHCLIRLPDPPRGFEPPMLLRNPGWVRPFEALAALFGTPAAAEADPSRIVAIFAPLMFGYMFGDVGHGLVVLAGGLALRRRLPALGMLVPGGVVSVVFGFLFGSVFAREDLIPAVWLHPLEAPLQVLAVALGLGAAIVLTGLLLDVLQAAWAREPRGRWRGIVGVPVAYLGLLGLAFDWRALAVVAAGAAWYVAGSASIASTGERLRTAGRAVAGALEMLFQLVVNTLSFLRIGAFALAHAGLGIAIVGLAEAAGPEWAAMVVLVLGNAVIVALEGLVVSIQTTRLVLFEFFIRFLRSGGRRFRPLPSPTQSTG